MDHNNIDKLVSALLNMYQRAIETVRADLSHLPDDVMAHQPMPQVCALETAEGPIIGGVALNPFTHDNPDAEDAVQLAKDALEDFPGLAGRDFRIAAVAMSAPVVDLDMYEPSLAELELITDEIIFVNPEAGHPYCILTFPAYEFVS